MFDSRLHDHWDPPDTADSQSLVDLIRTAGRAENQAAARRLIATRELFEMRRHQRGEQAEWAVDTWAAVSAEVAAALRISVGKASSYLSYALALERLPAVATVFAAGDIDVNTYRTIVYRTELITDPTAMTEVDALLAVRAGRWPSMTHGALIREIDRIVAQRDRDAVRRSQERARDRDVTVWDCGDGTADVSARLLGTDAALLGKRLDALAATVCDNDPRTVGQRRADAVGALAAGAERLMCRCANPDCPAASTVPDSQTYITTPGSALLFPALMTPTGNLPQPAQRPEHPRRTAMMPRRRTTRALNRAHRIATERAHNRKTRPLRIAGPDLDADDPPF